MNIAVVGNGSLAEQLLGFLNPPALSNILYFDDFHEINFKNQFPFSDFLDGSFSDFSFIIALGYQSPTIKNKIISDLLGLNRNLISFIHPNSYVDCSVKLGNSVFIYPMCNIDRNVILKDGVIINNSVVVSHDTTIEKCSYISPGVTICGRVSIGENCFIGAGTTISNDVTIGNNVKVGIGSVVTKNIPDNSNVIGNPLIFLKQTMNL